MIGIVVATHAGLGEALIDAAEAILEGPMEAVTAVSVDLKNSAEELRRQISNGIKLVDQGDGVLILTDMFGGTPSNLSLSFLKEGCIDVLTGVNLPVLIRAVKNRKGIDFSELAESLQDYGKKSILLASGVLKGNKGN
ncbi:MAG: PTS fructose transporter subunit IIA [Deltaproteobacteria bacterium]|nr:PTS fructose transporter subunit IIA [Deltaproteobacteria bacterium]RLB91249.1 MAG: PTS fructose transporter subunit IIA [Deltaproteobacteria bacterium]RLB92703.1 MAG: PTS fructose transporter subunit IIA [Deltaproteobacteria bacterium]RLC08949.1 MAG: PTS fructose transporter subunit IIA [Deltaproteobacteria bacterium]